VLEAAFPLLQQGEGNGRDAQAQPAASKPTPSSLESLLGGKE
jgi:hypothetical protein